MAEQVDKDKLNINVVTGEYTDGRTEAMDVRAFVPDPEPEDVTEVDAVVEEDEKPEPKRNVKKQAGKE